MLISEASGTQVSQRRGRHMTGYLENDVEVIAEMLGRDTAACMEQLFDAARQVRREVCGDVVYLRGLIEISNICAKDCYYCGIRSGNQAVARYQMTGKEVIDTCRWARENGFTSVVLQGGERAGRAYVESITDILNEIRLMSDGRLRVTLSLGEQEYGAYRQWREAGADRYLLRIETSSRELYRNLHPESCSFDERLRCLSDLKQLGYQTGTGVMIGLPGQTLEDLARDIIFFREIDADMIGMGPYLFHPATPLGRVHGRPDAVRQLELGLKMIAAARIYLRDVNIAAATALEALAPDGRERGIKAGANVVMPNLTAEGPRGNYCLYEGKPGIGKSAVHSVEAIAAGIARAGCRAGWAEWGDALHYSRRLHGEATG